MSSSASSSGEEGDMTEDSWSESDDELEGGAKSLSAWSSSVEEISLNPESCGESFGSAYSVVLGGAFFDFLRVRSADGVSFFCDRPRIFDGIAEDLVAERLGLAFNLF